MCVTLILGTMNFGKRTSAAEALRLMARAAELGITELDTANSYQNGESERVIGAALSATQYPWRVTSKVGLGKLNGAPEGLSSRALHASVTRSLQNLKRPFLDQLLLHAPDPATPKEDTLGALKELLDTGQIRSWGLSNFAAWQCAAWRDAALALGLPPPASLQVLYNLLLREAELELLPWAESASISVTVFNPLAGGLLAMSQPATGVLGARFNNPIYKQRYATDRLRQRAAVLCDLATKEGTDLATMALAWLMQRRGVGGVLLGPATLAHLEHSAVAANCQLSAGALAAIEAEHLTARGSDSWYIR